MAKVLIIEDDTAFSQMLQKFLEKHGNQVETSLSAVDAKSKLTISNFDVILTDLRLPDYDGIQLLSNIKEIHPKTPVIVMTGYAEVGTAVSAMKKGAFDYISKPFTPEEMLMLISSALESNAAQSIKEDAVHKAKEETNTVKITQKGGITGISDASRKLNEYINLVAPTDMSVLITGESGTGKEVTAKNIHDKSKRSSYSFVAVDCGAIPKEIATSEFFGHIKGSFTGAIEDKIGHFEAANSGTLFLDEVGNLSYENQVQLLRALQERKIKRVGSTKEIKVDVRIITATNENLLEAVEKGTFREDLYHRLNEFSIEIPALKQRHEDLALFSDYFLDMANESLGKNVKGFSDAVLETFQSYHWPGNLRELQNTIKRAVLLTPDDYVSVETLPATITQNGTNTGGINEFSKSEYEKNQILRALKQTNFNKSKAAKLLQVTRKTLYNKINYYNLDL